MILLGLSPRTARHWAFYAGAARACQSEAARSMAAEVDLERRAAGA